MVYRKIDIYSRSKGRALLSEHQFRPCDLTTDHIAHQRTLYRWQRQHRIYGSFHYPDSERAKRGRPRRIHAAAKKGLLEYQRQHPYLYQGELVHYLLDEWDLEVDRSTVNRLLKKEKITHKKGQRHGPQSQLLRLQWQADTNLFVAEQLVFVDEALWNMQSCWRAMAYAAIGHPARYTATVRRGDSWCILPAYTTEGYLPCTAIKKGWYDKESYTDWIIQELLPLCNPYPQKHSVICMDNASIHHSTRLDEAVAAKGCILKYLPPYSPDYNPIELSFAVLKSWLRKNHIYHRRRYEGNFGAFLAFAIHESRCDRFAHKHFQHAAGGYQFRGGYEECLELCRRLESGEIEDE